MAVTVGSSTITLGNATVAFRDNNGAYCGARAWVQFNGTTNPVGYRGSVGVSSVTYNGVGAYTVNWSPATSATGAGSINYAILACGYSNEVAGGHHTTGFINAISAPSCQVVHYSYSSSAAPSNKSVCSVACVYDG